MIYAMSDIHGYAGILQSNVERLDLSGENRLVLLGDYIDYGCESGQALRFIYELQQKYGSDKIIVLRGNHEDMFLEWLDTYNCANNDNTDENSIIAWNEWLKGDANFNTVGTLITKEQLKTLKELAQTATEDILNIEAVKAILLTSGDLIEWLRSLPYYYETENQIFVHAGIDEEAGEWWSLVTTNNVFTGKFPETKGSFYKDIIAGHIGTYRIANDPDFHGVYFDGASHYYIDGTVNISGKIPVLVYDEEIGKYSEL